MSAAVAVLVRALVLVAAYAALVLVLERVGSTDALGTGLMFFLGVVVVAAAWSAWDGWQRGLLPAVVVWVLVGVVGGFGVVAASIGLAQDEGSLGAELQDGWLFLGLLVAVPGVLGALLGGGLVRRTRRPATA